MAEEVGGRRIRTVVEEVGEPQAEKTQGNSESVGEVLQQTGEVDTPIEHTQGQSDDGKVRGRGKVSSKLLFAVIFVTAILVAVISGGVYVYYNSLIDASREEESLSGNAKEELASSTPAPSSSPEPSGEEVELVLGDYEVVVLNGSGAIGAAGKMQVVLEEAGFEVSSTGNAERFDFEVTELRTKEDVPTQVLDAIMTSLTGGGYEVSVAKDFLTDGEADIVVVVGKK